MDPIWIHKAMSSIAFFAVDIFVRKIIVST